jgi:enediyne biosynthesis protein E4
LYYNDFDDNGKKEQILTYYLGNKEIPFVGKTEMERQMPGVRKQFFYAKDFASATLGEILTEDKLESAQMFAANYFSHCILINKGNMEFDMQHLPWETQLSVVRDAMVVNANKDSFPDIMLMGNYFDNNVEMGRSDAGYGSILLNDGKGNFKYEDIKGVVVKGEARHVKKISIGGRVACVIAKNNDSLRVISKQERKAW